MVMDETPFSKALQDWKDELRQKDRKGRFYEMVMEVQEAPSKLSPGKEAEFYARNLQEFFNKYEEDSKFGKICLKIQPFVGSLKRLMIVGGTVGQTASMVVGGAIFSGAQLLLELAKDQEGAFNKMNDLMHEIDVKLFCNANNWSSFKSSKKMRELFVEDYKIIISIWHRAWIINRSI